MSELLLVRHAQASFGAADYDQLSPLGWQQARRLGRYWSRTRPAPTRVVVGPCRRHAETWLAARETAARVGRIWPEASVDPRLDEHRLDQLLGSPLIDLQRHYPRLTPLAEQLQRADQADERRRSFQRLYEAVGQLWYQAAPGTDTIPSWSSYRTAVCDCLGQLLRQSPSGSRVVVLTSVGPITAALTQLLGLDDAAAFALGWRVRNCSVTEFLFRSGQVTLDRFNALDHLPHPHLTTFR